MPPKKVVSAVAKPLPRDRINRLLVVVNADERAEIERLSSLTGLSISAYLRTAGLGYPIRSDYDYRTIQELARVSGDAGRLGYLLKRWLDERPEQGASVADVKAVLSGIRDLQTALLQHMGRVLYPPREQ
jgi:hypothetical protein